LFYRWKRLYTTAIHLLETTLWVISGHGDSNCPRPLCPRKLPQKQAVGAAAKGHKQTFNHSFDQFVREGEERRRYRNAERFGGLQVDDEFDFGCLLHRQIARLLAFKNAAGI
jgi:hypothetical protein